MNDGDFIFETPLVEGTIIKRNSQFIMEVNLDGEVINCHCPTTGRIGDIELAGIPCLLSKSKDTTRKTPYTVEAISVDLPSTKNKKWIGINQNAANRYVEHFLKNGSFSGMVGEPAEVLREQKLGISKMDFLVGNIYLEVKTPLVSLQVELGDHLKKKKVGKFNSTDRFVKHLNELANSLAEHQRAILLVCFIYDNPGFKVIVKSTNSEYVREQVESCTTKGVESWQVNFEITPERVRLSKYFKITI